MAGRHVDAVYRILAMDGHSKARIAAMAVQSEISEILSGRRVSSYDVCGRTVLYGGLYMP